MTPPGAILVRGLFWTQGAALVGLCIAGQFVALPRWTFVALACICVGELLARRRLRAEEPAG